MKLSIPYILVLFLIIALNHIVDIASVFPPQEIIISKKK